ncbi:hypothetical protein Pcinc_023996 [Petrolisthes cinctipes]|uniref:Protein kinase domain-containing protein n=1 Tax=Petrolisthes cinctipes TaxID=88211 RepID=A0AAE1FCE5_PETCI|nr:hypothetical protein Pcinc_023996 [Petrolisthes cinctipes]
MSPEQILNPTTVDPRADIYSAGVVLYELLTAERPFRGSVRAVLHDVLHSDPQPVRRLDDRIPRDLENICQKAIAREAVRRYQSAEEFRDDLNRFLNGEPVVARSVTSVQRLTLWARRNPIVAALAAIICVVLLGAICGWASFTLALADTNDQLNDTVESLRITNDNLTTARQRAVLGEKRARQHATVAQEQINVAFDMVSALVFEVQNELDDMPGTEKLRERLLTRAIDGLQRVRSSAADSVSADVGMIMARNRLGDALRQRTSRDAAGLQYEQAFADATRLYEQSPELEVTFDSKSVEPRLNAALGTQRLADLNRRAGDFKTAEQHLRKTVSVLTSAVQTTDSKDVRLSLAHALVELAELPPHTDSVASETYFQEAHDCLAVIDADGMETEFQRRHHFVLGLVCLKLAELADTPSKSERFAREAIAAMTDGDLQTPPTMIPTWHLND